MTPRVNAKVLTVNSGWLWYITVGSSLVQTHTHTHAHTHTHTHTHTTPLVNDVDKEWGCVCV